MPTDDQEAPTVDQRLANIEAQLSTILNLFERFKPLLEKAERWGKAKAEKARPSPFGRWP